MCVLISYAVFKASLSANPDNILIYQGSSEDL